MIRAELIWANGGQEIIFAESFPALFEKLEGYDRYIALDAREFHFIGDRKEWEKIKEKYLQTNL